MAATKFSPRPQPRIASANGDAVIVFPAPDSATPLHAFAQSISRKVRALNPRGGARGTTPGPSRHAKHTNGQNEPSHCHTLRPRAERNMRQQLLTWVAAWNTSETARSRSLTVTLSALASGWPEAPPAERRAHQTSVQNPLPQGRHEPRSMRRARIARAVIRFLSSIESSPRLLAWLRQSPWAEFVHALPTKLMSPINSPSQRAWRKPQPARGSSRFCASMKTPAAAVSARCGTAGDMRPEMMLQHGIVDSGAAGSFQPLSADES